MHLNGFSTLTLGCLLVAPAGAADTSGNSQDWYTNRIECRSVVLVGGYQAGGMVCKTRQEWEAYDRAAREKIV